MRRGFDHSLKIPLLKHTKTSENVKARSRNASFSMILNVMLVARKRNRYRDSLVHFHSCEELKTLPHKGLGLEAGVGIGLNTHTKARSEPRNRKTRSNRLSLGCRRPISQFRIVLGLRSNSLANCLRVFFAFRQCRIIA